jgi:hypothetical protein
MTPLFWILGGGSSPMQMEVFLFVVVLLLAAVSLPRPRARELGQNPTPGGDLTELHRRVDQLRRLLRDADRRGEPADELREALIMAQGQLPVDDLRRI